VKVVLRKTSLVDYPGKIACTLFFPGCNLRCPWCQNAALVSGGVPAAELIPFDEALAFIAKRRGVLGGVALSGGEPLLCEDLPSLIAAIKGLGLPVKLDTNGGKPEALARLFSRPETSPDYVALDLKSGKEPYFSGRLAESARLISASGADYEYRSLALPRGPGGEEWFTEEDVRRLAPLADGEAPWHFRAFRPGGCLDPSWDALRPPDKAYREALAEAARALGKKGIAS
jgi:pyruvate formate lyase activating enzyme